MNKTNQMPRNKLSCLLAIGVVAAGSSLAAEPEDKPLSSRDVIKMLAASVVKFASLAAPTNPNH